MKIVLSVIEKKYGLLRFQTFLSKIKNLKKMYKSSLPLKSRRYACFFLIELLFPFVNPLMKY